MNNDELVKALVNMERKIGLIETLHQVFGNNIKVNIKFSKKSYDANIDELNLSVRSYNALRRANVTTVNDLMEQLSNSDIKKIRNLGDKCYCEIKTKILAYGFGQLSENEKIKFFYYLVENNVAS